MTSQAATEVVRERFDLTMLNEGAQRAYRAMKKVEKWVEDHNYEAYEPFDGLSSPLRRFIYGNVLLERFLQQAVRQRPINIRPFVGVKPLPSTKGRGYMAAGYLTLFRLTGDPAYAKEFLETWRFADRDQTDWTAGEWHPTVDPDGTPSGEKAHRWKARYHNGRALLESLRLLDALGR